MTMFCDRCGKEIGDNATRCPICGMATENEVQYMQPSTYQVQQGQQGQPPQDDLSRFGGPPLYQMGYGPMPSPTQQIGYVPMPQQQAPGYGATSYGSIYPQGHVTVVQSSASDAALIAEIVLSLFGVFGVGWILGGETTVGIILLICSIFIYWPVMILGTLFTLGMGLICLGPLAIGVIILNALLCNSILKRRAARLIVMQSAPPHVPTPPMQRPQ
ncbi:MAG: hypothetical protein NVS4B11_10210 [Ktedonobacteraceae bacterium]